MSESMSAIFQGVITSVVVLVAIFVHRFIRHQDLANDYVMLVRSLGAVAVIIQLGFMAADNQWVQTLLLLGGLIVGVVVVMFLENLFVPITEPYFREREIEQLTRSKHVERGFSVMDLKQSSQK